jgi:outer membrane murein-binding lipoprotein Lpp
MPKICSSLVAQSSLAISLALVLLCGCAAQAQTGTSSQDDATKQLLDRVRELEAKVKQLEEKEAAAASAPPVAAAPAPVAAPEPAAVVEQPQVNEVAPRLKLLFFGDTGYQIGHFYGPTSTFEFGEFDMFATARLTDHISALAEILFTSSLDNSVSVDIERLSLKYHQNDYFNATIGRIHTAIGYYNTAFNRGDYFQTATGRPTMFEFDDQGGFLPLQDLGIVLNGQIPSGKVGLNYVFEVTNGRSYGASVEPVQNNSDQNNSKAVNFGLSAKPEKVPGLTVGFSYRHDYLSDVFNLHVSETIPVVYAVFTNSKYEWLNEAMYVTHKVPSGAAFHTTGFYSQFSRKFGHYRPYFRYDYVNSPANDPIYDNPLEFPPVERVNGPTVGLRWDFTRYTAVKLQYVREAERGEVSTNGGNAQFDFTF